MRYGTRNVALIVPIVTFAVISLLSQTAPQKPAFEVASIKLTTVRGPINTPPGGTFVAAGQSLVGLIQYAYRIRGYQVIGGPGWANTDLWVIQAKAPEGSVLARPNPDMADFDAMERMLSQPDKIALMLQSLLEDRFQLKIHHETKEMGVYELAVAKNGLKMKLAADQTRPEPPPPGLFPRQVNGELRRGSALMGRGSFEGQAIPFWTLFNSIRNQLDRPLMNKVDLKGLYDIKLKWEPDNLQATPGGVPPEGPSLTTALQEQLGLRLESTKGPVDVIVIESVQRPSEN
jgi:uncharacterized protein (TIGR03435 family)